MRPAREALSVWAAVLAALAAAELVGLGVPAVRSIVGALAVAAFLWVPSAVLERRGQDTHDAGFRFDRLGRDLLWAGVVCAAVLPLFTLGFWLFTRRLALLPDGLRALLSPYLFPAHAWRLPLPRDLAGWWELSGRVLGNAAVAVSEEFFYRGYLTLRLEERWPPRARVLGAPLGRAALLAALLFALGHLLEPAPWRLAVFFPALVFAWLRARTGTIVGAAACHWVFNVYLLLLERAAFG